MIDFDSGQITVFDFDNSCFCWYMFDLANVWRHGFGWIQLEQHTAKRKKFMEDYFETVLSGYRSETQIDNAMLEKLPLFMKVGIMEDDIPYMGFFHEIYSVEEPLEYEERII
jgi:Ser/Thr protein kinase RdoA (MazF antagonist)